MALAIMALDPMALPARPFFLYDSPTCDRLSPQMENLSSPTPSRSGKRIFSIKDFAPETAPENRPRARAFRSQCPIHRKRESQHHVSDCENSRNQLRC